MTSGEQWAVAGGVVVAGVVIYLVWKHHEQQQALRGTGAPRMVAQASGGSIGNAIAGIGGAAVATLGKEAAAWTSQELSGLFS